MSNNNDFEINEIWGKGKEFTVILKVKNPEEAKKLSRYVFSDDLLCGCKVLAVDFCNLHEKHKRIKDGMDNILKEFNKIAD